LKCPSVGKQEAIMIPATAKQIAAWRVFFLLFIGCGLHLNGGSEKSLTFAAQR
jgi:hypothetical protein